MGFKEVFTFEISRNNSLVNPIDIQFKLDKESYIEVSILDAKGKLIYNFAEYFKEGEYTHKIYSDNFEKGTYFLRIARNGQAFVEGIEINE